MLNNYRTTTNYKEISKLISDIKNIKESFLWQNTSGKRYIFEIEDIQLNERFMSFATKVNRKMFPYFNSLTETYCKLTHRDTVFKVSVINSVDNTVTFNIPSEVKTLELRRSPRQKFKPSEGKFVTIQVESELLASATQALKFQVIDVSETGISLVMSDKNIKYFESSSIFNATTLMDHELVVRQSMELVYYQKFKFKSRGKITSAYRVGLKFHTPLTTTQLAYFF